MGLDMYAYTVSADLIEDRQVDMNEYLQEVEELAPGRVNREFAYWRKFNHLHGWMEQLYRKKGGSQDTFNCTQVRLMPEDIDQLEQDMQNNQLHPMGGFFFGDDKLYPEDVESLQQFIQDSREAFKDNLAVLYDSWW